MLYELHDQPSLDEPVMVMVLEGWIDAGYAATTAAQTLLNGIESYPVATFDTDSLLDHRARRPVMHLVDGMTLQEVADAVGMSLSGVRKRLRSLRAGVTALAEVA